MTTPARQQPTTPIKRDPGQVIWRRVIRGVQCSATYFPYDDDRIEIAASRGEADQRLASAQYVMRPAEVKRLRGTGLLVDVIGGHAERLVAEVLRELASVAPERP